MEKNWQPPEFVPRDQCIKDSESLLVRPDLSIRQSEDVFRISALKMDWDIGVMIYEPENSSQVPVSPDGKKAGIFLLHGGSGDFRQMERVALLLARKFGYKVVSGTFPGRLYLPDPSRDWPGDTINPDGTVRTPIWKKRETISHGEYDVIKDAYGEVDPNAFREIPKANIPPEALNVGARLTATSSRGRSYEVRVHEIKDSTVVVDFNHPLAGKTLSFAVKIVKVTEPDSK